MLVFLFASIFAFCLSLLLILVNTQWISENNEYILLIAKNKLYASKGLIFFLIALLALILLLLILYIFKLQVMEATDGLYTYYDLISGSLIDRVFLGLVFGFMLANFLARIYRREGFKSPHIQTDPDSSDRPKRTTTKQVLSNKKGEIYEKTVEEHHDKEGESEPFRLTVVEKVEGVVLLILLILGISQFSIHDLISAVRIDSPVVKFQLRNQTQTDLDRADRDINVDQLNDSQIGNGNGYVDGNEYAGSFNSGYLYSIGGLIKRDAELARNIIPCPVPDDNRDTNDHSGSCEKVEWLDDAAINIQPLMDFNRCLVATESSEQEKFVFGNRIAVLIPHVARIYHAPPKHRKHHYDALRVEVFNMGKDIAKQELGSIRLDFCKEFAPALRKAMAEQVEKPGSVPVSFLAYPLDEAVYQRPYFSILFATLLALDKQYSEAVYVLQDWISKTVKDTEITSLQSNSMEFWMTFRALSIQVAIFDAWARDPKAKYSSEIILGENLRQLDQYLEMFEEIPVISKWLADEQTNEQVPLPEKTWRGISLRQKIESRKCKLDGKPASKSDVRLIAAYQTASTIFAFRGVMHESYAQSPDRIDRILTQLIQKDHGCLKQYYGARRGFEEAISEMLRTYGVAQLQKIKFRRDVGDDHQEWLKDRLELANTSFRSAASIIEAIATTAAVERASNSNRNRYVEEHAEWLKRDLDARITTIEKVLGRRD